MQQSKLFSICGLISFVIRGSKLDKRCAIMNIRGCSFHINLSRGFCAMKSFHKRLWSGITVFPASRATCKSTSHLLNLCQLLGVPRQKCRELFSLHLPWLDILIKHMHNMETRRSSNLKHTQVEAICCKKNVGKNRVHAVKLVGAPIVRMFSLWQHDDGSIIQWYLLQIWKK